MSILNRMRLWQKLATLALVLLVPTIFLGVFYFARLNAAVTHAREAIEGVRYTKALGAMLAEIGTHRSRMREARATPTAATQEALAISEKKLDQIVADIDAIDVQVGQRFNVTEQWQAIRSQWVDLKTNLARLEVAEASNRHDAMLESLMKHTDRVALRSGMSREDDLSTFVAIRLAVDDVPHALLAFSEVRRYVNISMIKGEVSDDVRTRIGLFEGQFERYLDRAREGVQDTTDDSWAAMQPAIEKAEAAFATYDAFVKSKVINVQKLEIQVADAYRASREPTAALAELSSVAYATSNSALEKRLAATLTRRTETIVIVALALALAFALMRVIARSLTRPMSQAIAIFHSIAGGMYDNRIEHGGTDEASQVLRSLDDLQHKLRAEVAGGESHAMAELRIKGALDNASARVMLADEQFNIIYANDATRHFLLEAKADFRRELSRLDVEHIVGQSLDRLFKSHVNQRKILQESPSYTTDLRLGERLLRITANALTGPDGRRIGTVVELLDNFAAARAAPALAGTA